MLDRRTLGTSDLVVSVVAIGANTFGPPRLDQPAATAVIEAALDLGVNFVDTAISYGQGHSEEFLGKALGARRDHMVIATKFNLRLPGEGTIGERIVAQAETSLRRLQSDYIDLYQIHLPHVDASHDDVLTALDDLVRAGKVRAIGASNYSSWRLAESAQVASSRSTVSFATVQNYYNLLGRQAETEVIPWCRRTGMSVLPYHPLAGGFLTGKYRRGEAPPEGTRGAAGSQIIDYVTRDANYDTLDVLETYCAERGHRVGELAIAWLLANPVVASVIAGVSTPGQLAANVQAASWVLSAEEKAAVDAIVNDGLGRPVNPEVPPYVGI